MPFPTDTITDSLPDAGGTNFLSVFHGGSVSHADGTNLIIDDLDAAEIKVGVSESSAQDTPLANTVLASDTNGKSKWRKVATADLAANAITQSGFAAGSSGSQTTTSTSFVDLTDLSVTLTTTGGDLLVFACSAFNHATAGQGGFIGLRLDSGSDLCDLAAVSDGAGGAFTMTTIGRFTGVSAGSHTVKGRWKSTSGGANLTAPGNQRYLLVVELKK